MAQTVQTVLDWVPLLAFVLLALLLLSGLIILLFREPAPEEPLGRYPPTPPTTPPTSGSFDDQCRRSCRLEHMGAPSPGARQPKWLTLARQEAGREVLHQHQRQREKGVGRTSEGDPGWSIADRLADEQHAAMVDAAAEAAAEATAEIAAQERERMLLVDEMADDDEDEAYPYDADWDDHNVDWGETK